MEITATCPRTVACSYVFWGFGMVLAFKGAGDTATPTRINFFVFWLVQIPLGWTLAGPVGPGLQGVFMAIAISQCLLAATGVVVFRGGG
jgi:Na+-driven multidrug efflux pump